MDGRAKASLGIAAVLVLFFMLSGSGTSDSQGWGYSCPSAYTMFTRSGFIHIPVAIGSGPDVDPMIGRGEPDGRRVFGKCKAAANRNAIFSVAAIAVGLGAALYYSSSPARPSGDDED